MQGFQRARINIIVSRTLYSDQGTGLHCQKVLTLLQSSMVLDIKNVRILVIQIPYARPGSIYLSSHNTLQDSAIAFASHN